MLSNYYKKIADKYGINVGDVKKLVPNLGNKINDVLHYRNLQLYLSLRTKLTKIYKILRFKQYDWMKTYTDFNTEKRKLLAIVSKKMFFKQMINSVYGKAMENLRKRISVKLKKTHKFYNMTNYMSVKIYSSFRATYLIVKYVNN